MWPRQGLFRRRAVVVGALAALAALGPVAPVAFAGSMPPAWSGNASTSGGDAAGSPAPRAARTDTGTTGLLAVGAPLPDSASCATKVRAAGASSEIRPGNAAPNARTGGGTGRVDGAFTGTTEQILSWAACKWGLPEDVVKAQAAVESWWRMDTKGDFGIDAASCPAGHGIGADGRAGQCPQSYGLLQVRYPFNRGAFPAAQFSSAYNVDHAYAQWRACYEGRQTWLRTTDGGSSYAAGDMWGCVGLWFSGRWHTAAADSYIAKVRSYMDQRIWTTGSFRGGG